MFWWAGEVPHSSHRPVIFTARLVQFDAQPESCTETGNQQCQEAY